MAIKTGMISLGCPKNQVDAEVMLGRLRDAGMELTPHVGEADVVVINTCGFIEEAKQEAIENILEMAKLKKEGTIRGLVVTGCLAERYFHDLRREIPEINCILTVGRGDAIVEAVKAAAQGGTLDLEGSPCSLPFGGRRVQTTLPFYAYLKIADGCDNRCSYCIIPSLRGPYRSRPMAELLEEARGLARRGVKELILVAQDTTRYGIDLWGKPSLAPLLRELAHIDGLEWIRVLYCYPDCITDELIDVIASEPHVAKYIDMPIQHASNRILRLMNRRDTQEQLEALIDKLRRRIPGITLRTTVMTGFPGETRAEFEELCEFLNRARFERLGAFAFSCEEGTPAERLPGQLDDEEKHRRQDIVMEAQQAIFAQNNEKMLGKTVRVLTEGYDRLAECCFGRTEADAPDIDGKIFFTAHRRPRPGTFVEVKVTDTMDYDLTGQMVEAD